MEKKFSPGPLAVGANEMAVSEMKERLTDTIDATVDHGDAVGKLWSVLTGSVDSPLMCCYTGNGPTSEANAYLFAASLDGYALGEAVAEHFKDTDAPLGEQAREFLAKARGPR